MNCKDMKFTAALSNFCSLLLRLHTLVYKQNHDYSAKLKKLVVSTITQIPPETIGTSFNHFFWLPVERRKTDGTHTQTATVVKMNNVLHNGKWFCTKL